MSYELFIKEFSPIIHVYGAEHFPAVVLERMHFKIKDLEREQVIELRNELLDHCKFAPKVPDVVEFANLVRARHREGVNKITSDEGPRTPEIGKQAIAQIRNIFSKSKGDKS